MRTSALVGVIVLMVVAAACGDGATTTTTTAAQPAAVETTQPLLTTTTTIEPATTTTEPATTTTEPATTTTKPATTTTEPVAMTTIEAAVADVEAWLAADFAAGEPPAGVLGPADVVCEVDGPIPVGGVFACRLVPNTDPDLQLDESGIVVYVLDAAGRCAWSAGTDVPDSAAGLATAVDLIGDDLMCRDLMDPDVPSGVFGGVGRPADSAYFWSLAYWSLVGSPDRMDADLDGIPCETLHDAAVVDSVRSGGPVW